MLIRSVSKIALGVSLGIWLWVSWIGLPDMLVGQQPEREAGKPAMNISEEALEIHHSGMLFDGHNDLPWTMRMRAGSSFDEVDIAQPTRFHTDIPRLKKGGLKAQFWSVYVPASTDVTGNALIQTLEQIQLVHEMIAHYPDVFELALTADDVERIVADGKIASLIGVEGGHSIQNSLQVLRELYDRGARYMTLTHSRTLAWADSCTDEPRNNGLAPFGREVVREMNRLGMLVDLSHVSPKCMNDALDVAAAPVIFSHSSARSICDHPRNVPDDILERVSENGGVVMVNFYSGFVVPTEELQENRRARGTLQTVCDHIEHIIEVAGIDHVGIGSDYDGVGRLPVGLDDVSYYPNITQELLNRGYDREQIHKILGGNVLRVMREVEQVAARLKEERMAAPQPALFRLKVGPSEFDRQNQIVQVSTPPLDFEGEVVTLRDQQGNSYLGQLSAPSIGLKGASEGQMLTFVLPELAAGETVELSASATGLNSYREFEWHDDRLTAAELRWNDRPVMKYMYEPLDDSTPERRQETYKVYHHLFSPNGRQRVTKGPGGLFPHHRGLFYGFNRITYGDGKQADTWHCKNGAYQSHQRNLSQIGGPVFGRHAAVVYWHGQDGDPFAHEIREMTAFRVGLANLIEFNSILDTVAGEVKLDGDPQHAGFQFRASQKVPDETRDQTYYIRPDGKGEPGQFRNWSAKAEESSVDGQHVNLPWNALNFVIDDRNYTCVYLDHPQNPKEARYSERDYGRFGSYFEYTLTEDHPLQLRYRVWLQEGEMTVAEINRISRQFREPVPLEWISD